MPSQGSVTVGGLRLHYVEWGRSGFPPVVMLHGLSGFAHDWDDVAPALEQRYRLIALDQRGFGESDRAPDAAYALSDFAGDLEGFVAGMGLGPLTLLGHSLGGRIGILFAAHHPESVERLILVDAAPTMNPAGGKRVLERIAASPDSYETMEAALSAFQPLFPGYSPERLRRRLEQYLVLHPDGGLAIKRDPAFRERSRRHLAGHAGPAEDLWPLLSKLACPILALRGTRSDMVTPDLAQRMVAENGRIRLVEVDNAGHNIPAEQPAVLARAIEEFLDSAG